MEPRHFWGKDMDEALRAVRATLGPDALILGTRSVPENGAGKGTKVEITAMGEELRANSEQEDGRRPTADGGQWSAARGQRSESGPFDPSTPLRAGLAQDRKSLGQEELRAKSKNPALSPGPLALSHPAQDGLAPQEPEAGELREVRQQLAELKSMLCWLAPGMGQKRVLKELMTQGVSPDILARLAQETQGTEGTDEREKIRQALTRLIPTGGGVEDRREKRMCLALIGPTGVGKTTTVVKLTVRLARQGRRRVGWVSLDNRRIAGAEQLAVYAGVLGVPCEVVGSTESLLQAVERLSACDLVLIDTAGVSPRDDEGIKELAALMQEVQSQAGCLCHRTLLLSAATNGCDMTDWVKLYERVGFDSLLFTKVDECRHFGPLINIALTCGRPLSYITIGQRVVNDLEVARPEVLARLLLP